MLPLEVRQVTVLLLVEPVTIAANRIEPPTVADAVAGVIVTKVTSGSPDGLLGLLGVAAATVTTAEADLLGSSTLVAVTLPVPAVAGAV